MLSIYIYSSKIHSSQKKYTPLHHSHGITCFSLEFQLVEVQGRVKGEATQKMVL